MPDSGPDLGRLVDELNKMTLTRTLTKVRQSEEIAFSSTLLSGNLLTCGRLNHQARISPKYGFFSADRGDAGRAAWAPWYGLTIKTGSLNAMCDS